MKVLSIVSTLLFGLLFLSFSTDKKGLKVGDMAKDFTLTNIDGKPVSLKDYSSSKGVILIFTCNHCPFAKAYEDRIVALDKKFAPLGYPVLAINPNDAVSHPEDNFENMKIRAKEKGFTFPYLVDETQKVATAYGATRTPEIYLIDVTKGYQIAYIGAIDDNSQNASAVKVKYLDDAINALMNGKTPNPDFTKAVGCSIKWKKI